MIGLLLGGAAAPPNPPAFDFGDLFSLFHEHNHLCSNMSRLFCCPFLSSFLLLALSLTPFAQFFKWFVCFWGGLPPPPNPPAFLLKC